MQESPNVIFTKINQEERRNLFALMVAKKAILSCKSKAKDYLYTLRLMKLQDQRFFILEPGPDPIPLTGEEKVIISFEVENEKYFIQTAIKPSADGQFWRADSHADIFKLQRRQAFRINIPVSYKSKAIFRDPETDQQICVGILNDISSHGCKVTVTGSSNLVKGQLPLIDIYVGRRDPVTLIAEIRHIQKIPKPPQEALGILFKSVTSLQESKLFGITMELHRELTAKVGGE